MPIINKKNIIRPNLTDLKEILLLFYQHYPDAEFKILQSYDEYTTIQKNNLENQILQCPHFQGIHIFKKQDNDIIVDLLIRDKCENFFSPEQKYNNHIKLYLKNNRELFKQTQNILEKNSTQIKEILFNWVFSFYRQITLYCLFFIIYFSVLILSNDYWVINTYIAAIACFPIIDYLKTILNPVQFSGRIQKKYPLRKTFFLFSLTFPFFNIILTIF